MGLGENSSSPFITSNDRFDFIFIAKYNAHNDIVRGMKLTMHMVDNKNNILYLLPNIVNNQCY